ncbi:S8 family serine peptidase [Christiangramia aquimixticola]|uniref:S8 family serine peptidase n=1 Tax=Christiangramia aquimixticola TaxID=1697558 RepID=UPI003AA7C0B4
MRWYLIFFLLYAGTCFGQTEHARIYFIEKANTAEVLQNPQSILSEKAVQRKELRGTPMDHRDIPVDEEYISALKNMNGIQVLAKSKWFNCAHVLGERAKIEELADLDFVESVVFESDNRNSDRTTQKPLLKNKLEVTPKFKYGLAETQVKMLGVDHLHNYNFSGQGMTIAVMDAGYPGVDKATGFARLRGAGKLLGGYDFTTRSINYTNPSRHNHGTMVLSTMAGFIKDQFAGTAPDASYYLFITEVAATETPVEESYWVEAAERADSLGVDIINTSLGYSLFDDPKYHYSPEDMDGVTAFISKGANMALEKGILVISSAGNSGNAEYFHTVGAPADASGLTVGAVSPTETYASFSSRGPTADGRVKPDVAAQGMDVTVINENNQFLQVNGTSFSSPLMAGAAASFWQINPEWTNLEVLEMVRELAHLYANPNVFLGLGIPDFSLSPDFKTEVEIIEKTGLELFVYPNPVEDFLKIGNFKNDPYTLRLFDITGRLLYITDQNQKEIDLSGFSRGIYIAMFEKNNSKKSFILIKK